MSSEIHVVQYGIGPIGRGIAQPALERGNLLRGASLSFLLGPVRHRRANSAVGSSRGHDLRRGWGSVRDSDPRAPSVIGVRAR